MAVRVSREDEFVVETNDLISREDGVLAQDVTPGRVVYLRAAVAADSEAEPAVEAVVGGYVDYELGLTDDEKKTVAITRHAGKAGDPVALYRTRPQGRGSIVGRALPWRPV